MALRTMLGLLLLVVAADAGDEVLSDDAAERRTAVAALDVWNVPLLIDMLEDDHEGVRSAAAERLVALGRAALPVCARFLTDASDPAKKPFVLLGRKIHALGAALTPTDCVEGMQSMLRPADRRAGAVYALLSGIDSFDEDGVTDVLVSARRDADKGAREMAATSLALLGWGAVSDKYPASDADMEPVMAALTAKQESFRHPAYWLIGLLRPSGKMYLATLKKPPVEDDAYSAWVDAARARLGDKVVYDRNPPTLEQLLPAVKSLAATKEGAKFKHDLGEVLRGLRRLGTKGAPAAGALAKLMRMVEPRDCIHVGQTLLAIDPTAGDDVAEVVGRVAGNKKLYAYDRFQALRVVAGIAPPSVNALPAYTAALDLPDAAYKGFAADRMVRQGASFLYALRAKRVAALGLARLGPKAAPTKDALRALLKHPDARLRYGAALALRKIG